MRVAFLILMAAMIAACSSGDIEVYPCAEPCHGCEDPCTPCPGGECVPRPPPGWDGPVLLWSGEPDDVPECPQNAPDVVYEGHDGLTYTPACPSCSCGPAACVLPVLELSTSAGCQTPGQPYGGPEGWAGECINTGTFTFNSLKFTTPTVAPCEVQAGEMPPQAAHAWETMARACQASKALTVCDEATICAPRSEPPPSGYEQCIYRDGEQTCPPGYPGRHVFFGDIDTSTAGCSPCTCSAPQGATCVSHVDVYLGSGCTGAGYGMSTSMLGPGCADPGGSHELASSMSGYWHENTPGTCTPGGGSPLGQANPAQPATFCCLSQPAPEP